MRLSGKHVDLLVAEEFEDLEFWVTLMRLQEEGARTIVVGSKAGETCRSKSGGLIATAERAASDIRAEEIDGGVVPSGWAPDKLRRDPAVLALVRAVREKGGAVAALAAR